MSPSTPFFERPRRGAGCSWGLPGSPPPEVLAQIALAAALHQQLRRSGRHVRFRLTAAGVRVELLDRTRGDVRPLPIAEAFALSAGAA